MHAHDVQRPPARHIHRGPDEIAVGQQRIVPFPPRQNGPAADDAVGQRARRLHAIEEVGAEIQIHELPVPGGVGRIELLDRHHVRRQRLQDALAGPLVDRAAAAGQIGRNNRHAVVVANERLAPLVARDALRIARHFQPDVFRTFPLLVVERRDRDELLSRTVHREHQGGARKRVVRVQGCEPAERQRNRRVRRARQRHAHRGDARFFVHEQPVRGERDHPVQHPHRDGLRLIPVRVRHVEHHRIDGIRLRRVRREFEKIGHGRPARRRREHRARRQIAGHQRDGVAVDVRRHHREFQAVADQRGLVPDRIQRRWLVRGQIVQPHVVHEIMVGDVVVARAFVEPQPRLDLRASGRNGHRPRIVRDGRGIEGVRAAEGNIGVAVAVHQFDVAGAGPGRPVVVGQVQPEIVVGVRSQRAEGDRQTHMVAPGDGHVVELDGRIGVQAAGTGQPQRTGAAGLALRPHRDLAGRGRKPAVPRVVHPAFESLRANHGGRGRRRGNQADMVEGTSARRIGAGVVLLETDPEGRHQRQPPVRGERGQIHREIRVGGPGARRRQIHQPVPRQPVGTDGDAVGVGGTDERRRHRMRRVGVVARPATEDHVRLPG